MPFADPEAQRAWQKEYSRRNAEKIRARARAWQQANPERAAARKRRWVAANREHVAAQERARHEANVDVRRARARADSARRRRENPEQMREKSREASARRRARERGAFVERIDPVLVWHRDGGICGICNEPADGADWHLDHVIALARGGPHCYANVQVAHPFCNRSKAAR